MFKVNNKNTRTTSLTWSWFSLFLTLNIFASFASVSVIDFEQVNLRESLSESLEAATRDVL